MSRIVVEYSNISASSYLFDKVGWFKSLYFILYVNIRNFIWACFGYKYLINVTYFVCLFIALVLIKKINGFNYKKLYYIMLCVSPFLIDFLCCSSIIYRSVISFSFVCSFIFFDQYDLKKYIKYLLIFCCVLQFTVCEVFFYFDYQRYLNDVKISNDIYNDCNSDSDTVIVIRGIEKTEENIYVLKGEILGYSYFEWGDDLSIDDNRVMNFMNIIGLNFKRPTEDVFFNYYNIDFTDEYPNQGYIKKEDNVCYVNLGK